MDWVHELSFEGNGSEEIIDKEWNNSQKITQTWKRHQECSLNLNKNWPSI